MDTIVGIGDGIGGGYGDGYGIGGGGGGGDGGLPIHCEGKDVTIGCKTMSIARWLGNQGREVAEEEGVYPDVQRFYRVLFESWGTK